jgi:hypothetical protein
METFAFWFYCLIVFPLALEALAGPIALGKYGFRVVVPALVVLWLLPIGVMYYVLSAPEILVWLFPIEGMHITPPVEALICYTLPVWLPLLAIWLAAHFKRSLTVQSVISASVSAAMLLLVSPALQTRALLYMQIGS